MISRIRYVALLLGLAIALMACQLFERVSSQVAEGAIPTATSTPKDIPTEQATLTGEPAPAETEPPAVANPDPVIRDKPPQSQAAEIRPNESRLALTHLSNLIGYQVLDENGDKLGVASDYIVNTCETYLIYILMEPEASLNVSAGSQVLIPFEAVTINSGVLDTQNKVIQLRLILEQFLNAPVLPTRQQLTPTDWEGPVREFWSNAVRIGKLATSCNVPGGPVYKVAYATQLLGVELYDGRNNLLGQVQEAILEPESGKVSFYIVEPAEGDGLVMVDLPATNIPKEALSPGGTLSLVLLTEPEVFWEAPRITSVDDADDYAMQGRMRQYWRR